jgi:hypothetical protein
MTSSEPNPNVCVEYSAVSPSISVQLRVKDRKGRISNSHMSVDPSQFGNKAVITWQSQLDVSKKNITPVGFETGDEILTFLATPNFFYNSPNTLQNPCAYLWQANVVHSTFLF